MNGSKSTIIYISREIERALGVTPSANYYIVTNRNSYSETIKQQYPEYITLIDSPEGEALGTGDLMKQLETEALIAKITETTGVHPYILVFKNTARIEPIASEHGWTLLNPSEAISEKIENKITQIAWLGELTKFLPSYKIEYMKNISWDGKAFIVQWAHGHTGGGTLLIQSEADLSSLKLKFPERRCRVTDYIDGPSFTINVIVSPDTIQPSTVSYQITGMKPFTDSPFATIGNDWKLPQTLLTPEDKVWIRDLVAAVSNKMQNDAWRGLFGIDMIKDASTGKMYFIEVNARQPASATFESALQEKRRHEGVTGATTFEAHLLALLGEPMTDPVIEILDGAQIVQRVTKTTQSVDEDSFGSLELSGYTVVSYPNTEENADLVRVQSRVGIMAGHNILGPKGKEISETLYS